MARTSPAPRSAFVVGLLASAGGAGALPLTSVALTSDMGALGPNVEAGASFSSFSNVIVDASGRIVFNAVTTGVPAGREYGLWSWGGASNTVVVRNLDLSPFSGEAVVLNSLARPNAGDDAAVATTTIETLVSVGGVLHTMTHTMAPAWGIGGNVKLGEPQGQVVTNGSGVYGFRNRLTGMITVELNKVVYVGPHNGPSVLAQSGTPAPDGGTWDSFGDLAMATDGGLGLRAVVREGGMMGVAFDGIWAGPFNNLTSVRLQAPAPDLPGGAVFAQFYGFSVADIAGTIIVRATTSGGGLGGTDDDGIWIGPPNGLDLALREGDQAPGLAAGVLIGSQVNDFRVPLLGPSGHVAIPTALSGVGVDSSNNDAIVAGEVGAFEVIVRTGDPAPMLGGQTIATLTDYAMNDAGTVVFRAVMTGGGTDQALYAWRPTGGLTLIAATGDTVSLPGGDAQVQSIERFVGTETIGAGVATGLGPTDRVAFRAALDNGLSAVVYADLPGPSAADLTGDGSVDGADLGLLLGAWGSCPGCPADLNGDDSVGGADLGMLLGAWGP